MAIARCCLCEHTVESLEGLTCCPNCGTDYPPNLLTDDVTVQINWGDLRALVIWAERWAGQAKQYPDMLRFVYALAKRLRRQHPDRIVLTLAEEIEELRREYGRVETNLPQPPPERLTVVDALAEAEDILTGDGDGDGRRL